MISPASAWPPAQNSSDYTPIQSLGSVSPSARGHSTQTPPTKHARLPAKATTSRTILHCHASVPAQPSLIPMVTPIMVFASTTVRMDGSDMRQAPSASASRCVPTTHPCWQIYRTAFVSINAPIRHMNSRITPSGGVCMSAPRKSSMDRCRSTSSLIILPGNAWMYVPMASTLSNTPRIVI